MGMPIATLIKHVYDIPINVVSTTLNIEVNDDIEFALGPAVLGKRQAGIG